MQTLGKALNYAVEKRTISANPVRAVKPPRKVKRQLEVWGLKDVLRFFEAAHQDRMGPLYVLAATTGLREGETLGLSWRDVHLDAPGGPILRVQQNLVRSSKGVEVEHLKTDEGRPVELTRMGEPFESKCCTASDSGLRESVSSGKLPGTRTCLEDLGPKLLEKVLDGVDRGVIRAVVASIFRTLAKVSLRMGS